MPRCYSKASSYKKWWWWSIIQCVLSFAHLGTASDVRRAFLMSDLKQKAGRLSPLGLLKEVFNWYPSSYPAEERKWVDQCLGIYPCGYTYVCRLLFKLDLSILIFACLCCKYSIQMSIWEKLLTNLVFVKYLGKPISALISFWLDANTSQTRPTSAMRMSVDWKKTSASTAMSSTTSTSATLHHMCSSKSPDYCSCPAQSCESQWKTSALVASHWQIS